jgi:hypothetical protein
MSDFCDLPPLDLRVFRPNLETPSPPTPDQLEINQGYFNLATNTLRLRTHAGVIDIPLPIEAGIEGVALTMPDHFDVSGSGTDTISVDWEPQPSNTFLAGSAVGGPDAVPDFRTLAIADFVNVITKDALHETMRTVDTSNPVASFNNNANGWYEGAEWYNATTKKLYKLRSHVGSFGSNANWDVIGTLSSIWVTFSSMPWISVNRTAGSPLTADGAIGFSMTTQAMNQVLGTPSGTNGIVALITLTNNHLPTVDVTKGGTGATTATAGFNNLSPLTTEGDLLVHDGANNVRFAKGTALQLIRRNTGNTALEYFTLGLSDLPTITVAKGGTGATTATEGFDNLSPLTTEGDFLTHDGSDNVRLAKPAALQSFRRNAAGTAWEAYTPAAGGTVTVNVHRYVTPGNFTYSKDASAFHIEVYVIAGGNGGGSGRKGASATVRYGGGGGAGGNVVKDEFPADAIAATVDLVVGAGGAGGTAITVTDTNGNNGSVGGTSMFGGLTEATALLVAINNANGGGRGGTATNGLGGDANITWGTTVQFPGAAGGDSAGSLATAQGKSAGYGPASGGAGGGLSAANATFLAGDGGTAQGARGRATVNGGGGAAKIFGDGGGGGRQASGGVSGLAGGTGGTPGGGGGGGSASVNGVSIPSGAGGAGGAGGVIIFEYCTA